MDTILNEIRAERKFQDEKFGENRNLHPLEWIAILTEETGEAAKEVVEYTYCTYEDESLERLKLLRAELVQVAAVAVAFVEYLDRRL